MSEPIKVVNREYGYGVRAKFYTRKALSNPNLREDPAHFREAVLAVLHDGAVRFVVCSERNLPHLLYAPRGRTRIWLAATETEAIAKANELKEDDRFALPEDALYPAAFRVPDEQAMLRIVQKHGVQAELHRLAAQGTPGPEYHVPRYERVAVGRLTAGPIHGPDAKERERLDAALLCLRQIAPNVAEAFDARLSLAKTSPGVRRGVEVDLCVALDEMAPAGMYFGCPCTHVGIDGLWPKNHVIKCLADAVAYPQATLDGAPLGLPPAVLDVDTALDTDGPARAP